MKTFVILIILLMKIYYTINSIPFDRKSIIIDEIASLKIILPIPYITNEAEYRLIKLKIHRF